MELTSQGAGTYWYVVLHLTQRPATWSSESRGHICYDVILCVAMCVLGGT
jgi:hypothetical protein